MPRTELRRAILVGVALVDAGFEFSLSSCAEEASLMSEALALALRIKAAFDARDRCGRTVEDTRLCPGVAVVDPEDVLFPARMDVERDKDELIEDEVEFASEVRLGGPFTTPFIAEGGGGIEPFTRELLPSVVFPIVDGVSTAFNVLFPVSESDEDGRVGIGVANAFDSLLVPILDGGAGVLPAVPHTPSFLFSYRSKIIQNATRNCSLSTLTSSNSCCLESRAMFSPSLSSLS